VHRLSIKSLAPAASSTPNPTAAYAVLCSPDKTWQLRQVATSNSLFVTQSALEAAHGNDIPVPTTRAIASCTTTLELHPSNHPPLAYLEDILPIYDLVDGEAEASGNGKSKASIFPHLPLSDGQCEQAWKDLIAFEYAGSSYRPSANTLTQVWRAISAYGLAEGVKFDQQFLTDDITRALAEEGFPASLVAAILTHLNTDDQDSSGPWSCLDRSKTVPFVGKNILGAKQDGSAYLTADFLDKWRDSLPEPWRKAAELKAIEGFYELPSSTTVQVKGGSNAASKAAASAPKASDKTRKWHEKLGRARKR
jgi:hypothetical protein